MTDYASKSYGRNNDVDAIYKLFNANHDVSMPGARRLGKSFLLDRLVDAGEKHGWIAVKVEVAGADDTQTFFRELCKKVGTKRSGGQNVINWLSQRLGQAANPRHDVSGPWYQPFLSLDHQTYFERLVKALHDDSKYRWVLLIDELPIFLRALHEKGPQGVADARNFMNLTSTMRANYSRVRWMVTGSIGLEPLAQAGNYMGVLAKYFPYELRPLSEVQAQDFVKDLAAEGRLMHRKAITDAEAKALVDTVGWRAAYYLEALALNLSGEPTNDALQAQTLAQIAMKQLIRSTNKSTFGVWEEHLNKHWYADRAHGFAALTALAPHAQGMTFDAILASVGDTMLTKGILRSVLLRLNSEGFVTIENCESDNPGAAFLNPMLRHWWYRNKPQATT